MKNNKDALHPLINSTPLASGLPDSTADILSVCAGMTSEMLYASNGTPVVLHDVKQGQRHVIIAQ